jgi:hypothetical protein
VLRVREGIGIRVKDVRVKKPERVFEDLVLVPRENPRGQEWVAAVGNAISNSDGIPGNTPTDDADDEKKKKREAASMPGGFFPGHRAAALIPIYWK